MLGGHLIGGYMSINLEFIDIALLSSVLDAISEISDFSFSTYDSSGALLIPFKREDKLISQIKAYASGKDEHEKFIRSGIERAVIRKEASVFKGPANQHHLFIPVIIDNDKIVLVSSAFYLVRSEFEDFVIKRGQNFGFSPPKMESWVDVIAVKDYASVQKVASHLKSLLENILRSSYERNLNYKRYQWAKTLIDVLYNMQLPAPIKDVHSLIVDALLFLFHVDTVSIMVKEKNFFKTVMSSGKLRDDVISLYIEDNNHMISRAIEGLKPTSTNDIAEISRLGFPDSINSMHIFPIACKDCTHGVIAIYNSVISREEAYSILEFCKLVCLVFKANILHNAYDECINDMHILNTSVTKLAPQLHNPDLLYESIVDTATELLTAEKGSLMLPEGDSLLIKAVKGINKWLAHGIRIKSGEGIAGRVFKDGAPLFIKDVNKMELPHIKPKPHYKTGSFVSVPLKFASETMGVLNVTDKTTGKEFTERDFNLLNQFASYASISLKVSNYYNLAEQMKELSITDHLTGLFNRRYFQERFTEEIHRSERYNLIFSLAIFDIDDFKLLNDTEGHLAGDSVLKELSRIARECLRVNDVLCRFGGEEFAILMPQTHKDEAFIVTERIRNNIKESLIYRFKKFPRPAITVSIGLASFPEDGRSVNEMIRNADIALYKAKESGKDRTVLFSIS